MAYNLSDQQTLLYFYDLPTTVTSVQITSYVKEKSGIDLEIKPQIRRDVGRYFYTAIVKISDQEKFSIAKDKLKYPTFQKDEKTLVECRVLPFDKDFMGPYKSKLNEKTIFVKKIPQGTKYKEFEDKFKQFGTIKSIKISISREHVQNGYGFVCFEESGAVQEAINATKDQEEFVASEYRPKDKKEMQKAFNNLYVKNFPKQWGKVELTQLFSQYGEIIEPFIVDSKDDTKFAFICYFTEKDPNTNEIRPQSNGLTNAQCAQNAVNELHEKQIDEEHKLYVKQALPKSARETEKIKDMLRYKNSKKRCNLYVKNIPQSTTKDQLNELFSRYGQIESIKVLPKENEALYAFVCFKQPEDASKAKVELNGTTFNNKNLYINHYEIKENRKIQQEEMRDTNDFNNLKKSSTDINQMIQKPETLALLNQIFQLFQPRFNQQQRYQQQQRPYQNKPQYRQNQPGNMPKPQQMNMQNQFVQGQMPQQPPQMQQQFQQPMINPMMQQQQQEFMRQQHQMRIAQQQLLLNNPLIQAYLQKSLPILPSVTVQNHPHYKTNVGEQIFEFVEKIVGEDKAPKITGMLIDLPIEEIRQYLSVYEKLEEKVREADNLLLGQQ